MPNVMSAVSDGVNTGMVWKNSSMVKDYFMPRFEKVCDLPTTTTAFTILQSLYLNPGNSTLFPVFSQIAVAYEEYICHRLRFWYRGEEYMASGSTTSAGILVYATNMDPDDPQFANIGQMENYEGSISGPPFAGHFMHDVGQVHSTRGRNRGRGTGMALNQYFVYSSANQAAPSNSTAKFYDLGLFQIASNGTQTASPAGELWVEHEWTLIRRKQETPQGQSSLYAHIIESPLASAGATSSYFLGSSGGTVVAGSTIPCLTTKNTFTLPVAGTFILSCTWTQSVTAVPSLSPGGNITLLEILQDSTKSSLSCVSGGVTNITFVATVAASGTGALNTLTITGLTNLASGSADIIIAQVSSSFQLDLRAGRNGGTSAAIVEAEYARLIRRVDKLERGVVVTEPDTPTDDDCKVAEVNPLTKSVHIPASRLHEFLGLAKTAK